MIESNYDLLAFADARRINNLFKAFESYNATRFKFEGKDYDNINERYNKYGDIIIERLNNPDDTVFNEGKWKLFPFERIDSVSVRLMNEYYSEIADKGAKVYYSYGPLNYNALGDGEKAVSSWVKFENRLKETLDRRYVTIISDITDCLFEGKYFYDSDYHLTNEGAVLRTNKLIADIKNSLG